MNSQNLKFFADDARIQGHLIRHEKPHYQVGHFVRTQQRPQVLNVEAVIKTFDEFPPQLSVQMSVGTQHRLVDFVALSFIVCIHRLCCGSGGGSDFAFIEWTELPAEVLDTEVVAGVGIEPTTRGFSIRCSTN
jgi:hypothetical protein